VVIRKLGRCGWHGTDMGQDMQAPPTRAEVSQMSASAVSALIEDMKN